MTNIPDNKKIYDETWVDWVDMKIYGPASRWLRALIKRQLTVIRRNTHPVTNVLDVGCGEGTITHLLFQELPGTEVTGVDFSQTGITCATQAYGTKGLTFLHDPDSTALTRSYDLVTAFEVLEHVPEWQTLLGRMADASKQYLLLSFPTGRMRPFEVNVGHVRNFKKAEVETFLATKGFAPLNVYYAGFPFYNPLYRNLCNMTDSGGNAFTRGKYSWLQKAVGYVGCFVFDHLSSRRRFGDQFCGLFVRVDKR